MSDKKYIVGVDLGGTKLSTVIINKSGEILARANVPTDAQKGPDAVIQKIKDTIHQVMDEVGATVDDLEGIGIGSPGPLDAETGVIKFTPNLPGWINIPLKDKVQEEFNVPIKVDNDANAAAVGEGTFGAGKGVKNFVYITVSTGIGGGAFIEGKLFHGENSNGAELGHTTIDMHGPQCGCGNYGCWEALASGTAFTKFAIDGLKHGRRKSLILDMVNGDLEKIDAKIVFDAARKGDEYALEMVEREAELLGVGISNIINNFNPRRIIIGGGMSNDLDMMYDRIMKEIDKRALKANAEVVEIVRAKLGKDAGVLGAAALILNQ
ncbi:glucokinase [Caldanaerobius fijiensis DSM 17918]|uniref:Glucokinase n=1 Tax=Caldanaerobius fijiensis DSM 17918 TaxID=1121256 RepID=A0A1M4WT84_9THEO|nr:ROK family glucokinase [Caldanaerobius fijiensis]SHE84446.1 glucokinase [Caldanaerobius fijiensis DSM 17918]